MGEEERSRQREFTDFTMLRYQIDSDSGCGLDDILAEMRALPSVTIVTVATRNRKIERTIMLLVWHQVCSQLSRCPRSPEDAKTKTIADIRKIKGVTRIFKLSAGFERVE